MNVETTALPGVLLIEPRVFADDRGYFLETWNRQRSLAAGLPTHFEQDNLSHSHQGVLRGLHFQHPQGQGKLVSVLHGSVWDVAVDVQRGSPTFGRWVAYELSAENHRQLYIPPGYAHGFCVLSEAAVFVYKCTSPYAPAHEHTLLWNDPELGIPWPVTSPILSPKDALGLRLSEFPAEHLPGQVPRSIRAA